MRYCKSDMDPLTPLTSSLHWISNIQLLKNRTQLLRWYIHLEVASTVKIPTPRMQIAARPPKCFSRTALHVKPNMNMTWRPQNRYIDYGSGLLVESGVLHPSRHPLSFRHPFPRWTHAGHHIHDAETKPKPLTTKCQDLTT